MAATLRMLTPVFAAEVSGVDCRHPLSDADVAAIRQGMDDHAVLVFRGQMLTDEEQLRFSLQFGALERKIGSNTIQGTAPGPIHFRRDREVRTLGPGLADFSNVDRAGQPLARDSRAYMFKLADRLWHSDSSFRAVPASWSILSGHVIPSWGGNTEFADMRAAYDALAPRWRAEIEDLVCHHSQMYSRGKIGFEELNAEEREAFAPVRHRLVRTHPTSGRRSLFLSSHAGAVEGMSVPEARLLLAELTEFATQPHFVYSHPWQVGDLVMWDNQATMHRGTRFDPAEPRDIRQTRLGGPGPTIAQMA